ncbi:MAG: PIN domain-containing protein [Chthoniobacterales bacterium]|nr:PIN domain-containing protein [Chthoniobacterales bacterium]
MTSKIFFDANILIYSVDTRDPEKQEKARRVTRLANKQRNGVISTQVLQEYIAVDLKKFRRDSLIVKQLCREWQSCFEVILIRPNIIEDAIEVSAIHQFSFWDSLIISSALAARCGILMTEDLNHGQTIQGLTIVNPFKE